MWLGSGENGVETTAAGGPPRRSASSMPEFQIVADREAIDALTAKHNAQQRLHLAARLRRLREEHDAADVTGLQREPRRACEMRREMLADEPDRLRHPRQAFRLRPAEKLALGNGALLMQSARRLERLTASARSEGSRTVASATSTSVGMLRKWSMLRTPVPTWRPRARCPRAREEQWAA